MGFEACSPVEKRNSARVRNQYYTRQVRALRRTPPAAGLPIFDAAYRAQWDQEHPLGWVEHRQAWAATGRYGRWIATHDAVIRINDTLFLHAGLGPVYAAAPRPAMNDAVRAALVPWALDELDEEAERSEDSLERDGNPELLSDEDSPRLLDSERALDSPKELLRLLDPRRELLSDDDSARLLDSDRELDSSEELLELLPLDDLLRLLDSRPDSLDSRPDSLDSNPFSPREDASDCRLLDSEREERSLLSLPLSFSLASSQTGSWGTSFLDASELFQAGGNSSDTMAA